jgi:hypothetical protein
MIRAMRRRVPLALAVPVATAASFLAHAVASASPSGTGDADGMEHPAHAGPGFLPLAIGIAGATLALVLVGRFRRNGAGASAVWFAAFPATAYLIQETAERTLHEQLFPFPAELEPALAVVMAVHAAFGLLAFLLVRAVLAVVRRTLTAGAGRPTPVPDRHVAVLADRGLPRRRLPFVRDGPARAPPLLVTA